jgi:hypothetical protein
MPRFKNVSPLGWDLETWDGNRQILVPFGDTFEVTDEAADNPTFTLSGLFQPTDQTARAIVAKAQKADEEFTPADETAPAEPAEAAASDDEPKARRAKSGEGDK